MANRYWVGGSGQWSTTNTANWSTTSGGAGGASVPTSADSVFFDRTGTYTVTFNGTLNCLDLTLSAGTVTFAYTNNTDNLNVYGSFSITSSTTWINNFVFDLNFAATATGKTITTNGVSINSSINFTGVGGGWTLGSALTSNQTITVTNGTFSTGNFNITADSFQMTGTATKTASFGTSTVTLTATSPLGTIGFNPTGTTFNANTSTIVASSNAANFDAAGFTYYNVSFTGTAPAITSAGTFNTVTLAAITTDFNIQAACTFANLTFNALTTLGTRTVLLNASQTITGTLTVSAPASAIYRTFFYSNTLGTARTISAATVSLTDCDFQDITASGAAAPFTGTRIGNVKGNTNITFTAAKTVYWNLSGGGNITGTGWATTSTGTPAANNFPLAQDTAIFSAATSTLSSGGTITINADYAFGTIDMSARTTNTMTLSGTTGRTTRICGDFVFGSGVTHSYAGSYYFEGRTAQTITTAGVAWAGRLYNRNIGATTTISGDFTSTNNNATAITVQYGTLAATNVFLTGATSGVTSTGTTTRAITVSGTWTLSGASPWTVSGSGITISGGGTISLDCSTAKTFAGGGITHTLTLNNASTSNLTITGSNTFTTLSNSVTPCTFLFTAGTTTTVTNFNVAGDGAGVATIGSVTAAAHTLSKASGTVNANSMSISYSTATGGATWNAINSTNGGNNTGWNFLTVNYPNFWMVM